MKKNRKTLLYTYTYSILLIEIHSSMSIINQLRKLAASSCIAAVAWDYFRDPQSIAYFPFWVLAIHFIYFQLPIQNRFAVIVFHPLSFIGSIVIIILYSYTLFCNPNLEIDNMDQWDTVWTTVMIRSFLFHVSPLLFHLLDISFNRDNLIRSYAKIPRRVLIVWCIISFNIVGFCFDIAFPDVDEMIKIPGINTTEFLKVSTLLYCGALMLSWSILYFKIIRHLHTMHAHSYDKRRN